MLGALLQSGLIGTTRLVSPAAWSAVVQRDADAGGAPVRSTVSRHPCQNHQGAAVRSVPPAIRI